MASSPGSEGGRMKRKLKLYMASSVSVDSPLGHAYHNGSRQYTILCRESSQANVAKLLGESLRHLRDFCGIHEIEDTHLVHVQNGTRIPAASVVELPHRIYYKVDGFSRSGERGWFLAEGKLK